MSFFVTLPSNSSTNLFDNTISNFTTQLHIPIRFNRPYEVGLVEFSYDHFWSVNLGKLIYIHNDDVNFEVDIIHKDGDSLVNLFTKLNQKINKAIFDYEISKMLLINPSLSRKEAHERIYQGFLKKKRFFHDDDKDLMVIKDSLPFIRYNSDTHKLETNTISDHDHFKFEGLFSQLFNLDFLLNSKTPPILLDPKFDEGLYIINSLFVYTDIIKYQYVGDSLSPLLRHVIIPSFPKILGTESVIFDSPHYIPVNKSQIDTINIKIKDDLGNNIRFERGKSIVKLHFRPITNGF